MDVNQPIRDILKKNRKSQKELADYMKISKKTLDTRFYRGGFDIQDLLKIGEFLGYKLAFVNDTEQVLLGTGTIEQIPDQKEAIKDFVKTINSMTDETIDALIQNVMPQQQSTGE